MSNSIDKYKLEEKIRMSFLKNACNVELVAKECDLDYAYVLGICNKFKKHMLKDTNLWIGTSLASYIMMGSEERKAKARLLLDEEMAKQPITISICCGAIIKQIVWDNENRYVCEKCEKDCRVRMDDPRDKQLIIKLLRVLGEIDAATIEAIEKIGIIGKTEAPLILRKTTNYNLSVSNKGEKLGEEDIRVLKQTDELDGRSRQHIINELEKQIQGQITDAKFEERSKPDDKG